jgi:hypothetical protein
LDALKKISIGLDSFIYYNSLDSGEAIIGSEHILSVYMYHESSSIFRGTFENSIQYYYETAKEFHDAIQNFYESTRNPKTIRQLKIWQIKFKLNMSIYNSIRHQNMQIRVPMWEILKFLLRHSENNISIKARIVKVLEYYSTSKMKRQIEYRRFKDGGRPT